jgi:hypothetical protein
MGLAGSGSVTLTASGPGAKSGTQAVQLAPSGFVITGGQATTTTSPPSTVTVSLTALDPVTLNPVNPANDINAWWNLRAGAAAASVNLKNDNTTVGTLSANSVTISPGAASATTSYTPVNSGTSNISISGTPAGYTTPAHGTATKFTVTAPPLSLQWCPAQVGFNTVGPVSTPAHGVWCYPQLSQPAPAKGLNVTMTSSNPNLLLLSLTPNGAGSASITAPIAAGQTTPAISAFLIGLASAGKVTLTASATGYTSGTQTISLVPSGFTVAGGAQTTTLSQPSTVSVAFTALDPSTLNPIYPVNDNNSRWEMRTGAVTATLTLKNDNTAAGKLANSTFNFVPGSGTLTTTYTPAGAGTSNIGIVSTPAPYQAATGIDLSTQFVVTAPTITLPSVTVGKNLMTTTQANFQVAVPSNSYVVTVSVASTAQLLLSATGTDAGTASLTFKLAQGAYQTPQFWVYGIGSPGSATLKISAQGYATATPTVQIDPSGFVFNNQNFSTTTTAIATTLYIEPAALDPQYLTSVTVQQLRPGMTNTKVTATLTDQPSQGTGASKVGKITVNPVVFNGADSPNEQITSFEAIGAGQTLLKLTSPGFSNSASEVTATVTQ